jgi:hypothetical protein
LHCQKNFVNIAKEKLEIVIETAPLHFLDFAGAFSPPAAAGRSVNFVQRRFAHFQTKGTHIKNTDDGVFFCDVCE